MRKSVIISLVVAIVVIGLALVLMRTVGHPSRSVKSGKLQAVASFYPLYFFSREIGGDKADVTNIVPAGAEPHDYEPTPQDMAKMESCKLIILNGGGLEVWGDNIRKNINAKNTSIVVAGEGLTTQQVTEDEKTETDPHVWLAPPLAEKMVERIAQAFEQADPANKNYYQSNANSLKIKLSDLDEEYRQGLSACKNKNIITSHAAFGYLATAYGLNQVPIAGLSPDAEPSPRQLADIAKFAKDNNVKYIFFESLVSPKLSQTIAAEVGAKTLVLDPIEGLSEEEMAQGKTYFSIMKDNLTNLRTALQCTK
ncbi:MAG TPA: metal ABC transporter substrate-binding protein [Syntrophorhabdales bacterium]|nr:metal ABC transporter substrate-binding protein [Syntrophorhabdales bacterium]